MLKACLLYMSLQVACLREHKFVPDLVDTAHRSAIAQSGYFVAQKLCWNSMDYISYRLIVDRLVCNIDTFKVRYHI